MRNQSVSLIIRSASFDPLHEFLLLPRDIDISFDIFKEMKFDIVLIHRDDVYSEIVKNGIHMCIMEFIYLKVLVIGVIETREFILERLDFLGSGTTARRVVAQCLHHGNNKLLVDDWERNFSVVVIDEVQFDKL